MHGKWHRTLRRWPASAVSLGLAAPRAACPVGPPTRPPLATSGPAGSVAAPPTTTSTMPTGPGGPGRTADPIEWSDCPSEIPSVDSVTKRAFTLECGEVEVPKAYDNPASGTLSVLVARATAPDTAKDAPPLVVVAGYPGQNGTDQVAFVAGTLPADILAHYAVVVMDLRGTGASVPIDCVSSHSSAALLSLGADPTTPATATQVADL